MRKKNCVSWAARNIKFMVGKGVVTEDEFLRRREHVQGEGDFVLVFLEQEPANERGNVGCPLLLLLRRPPRVDGGHGCAIPLPKREAFAKWAGLRQKSVLGVEEKNLRIVRPLSASNCEYRCLLKRPWDARRKKKTFNV